MAEREQTSSGSPDASQAKDSEAPEAAPTWEHFISNITVRVEGNDATWVLKYKGGDKTGYVRVGPNGVGIGVRDRRLATRFDSPVWAASTAAFFQNVRVVKIRTKGTTKTSVWRKPEESYAVGVDVKKPVMPTPPNDQIRPDLEVTTDVR